MDVPAIVEVTNIMCQQGSINSRRWRQGKVDVQANGMSIVESTTIPPCSLPYVDDAVKPGRKAMACWRDQHIVLCQVHLSDNLSGPYSKVRSVYLTVQPPLPGKLTPDRMTRQPTVALVSIDSTLASSPW